MQRVWLLNGNNITYDKDISAGLLASLEQGVVSGFDVSGSGASAEIESGKALIKCTRTNGEEIMVFFENTANVPVDMTGTKKVYIEIDQAKLDDGSGNVEDGSGIGAITTDPSAYPSVNFVALYDIVTGSVTDARVGVKSTLKRTGQTAHRIMYTDANGDEQELAFGTNGKMLQSNWPSTDPSWEIPTVQLNFTAHKFTTAEVWNATTGLAGTTINQVVVDASNVTAGSIDVNGTVITAWNKETLLVESGSVSVESVRSSVWWNNDIISCDDGTDKIYIHFEKTSTITTSFSSPSSSPSWLTFDWINIISCDSSAERIYIHSGKTGWISYSFGSWVTNIYWVAYDWENIMWITWNTYDIVIYSWKTSTITTSFSSPSTWPSWLTYDWINIISCDYNTDKIYIHFEKTSTITTSFSSPSSQPYWLTYDWINIISCDSVSDKIYIHFEKTSTITTSFSSPSSSPRWIWFAYYNEEFNWPALTTLNHN